MIDHNKLRRAAAKLEAIDTGLGAECLAAADTIEEMIEEQALFLRDAADNLRLIDRIADLIGLPHGQELDQAGFERWFASVRQTSSAILNSEGETR